MVIAGARPHKARPAPEGDSTTLSSRDGLGPFRIEMPGRTDPARSSASSNVRQPGSLLTTNALLDDVWGHQFVTRRRPQTALHRNGCRDAAIALIAAPGRSPLHRTSGQTFHILKSVPAPYTNTTVSPLPCRQSRWLLARVCAVAQT